MKLHLYIGVLAAICTVSAANASDYYHEMDYNCWVESKYGSEATGNNWAYHFCGPRKEKCDGKLLLKIDLWEEQYHGDSFTFKNRQETYWCCDGTKEKAGRYAKSDTWIIDSTTKPMTLEDGSTCNKLIQTDACGNKHEIECTTPDKCDPGYIFRNGQCITPCEGDKVFENPTSNTCISCETTAHQGIKTTTRKFENQTLTSRECVKCDEHTEIFNRQTKECVKKSTLQQYSKEAMKECWRCPRQLYKKCVEAITTVDNMNLSGPQRLTQIDTIAAFSDGTSIVKKCYLNE